MSTIHHTYGPHVDRRYAWNALALSYAPWAYVQGKGTDKLKKKLREQFKMDAVLFGSGREALLALLRALEVRPGEEIIVQGYTCVVVPNAIHAAGALPIYADIDPDTLNLSAETVQPLITPRTRAIICQHTFGIPADTEALRALCEQHKILLIEDCAHILPDARGPKEIGTKGDYMLLSFGRDKAISGVSGGAILSKDPKVTGVLRELERTAAYYSFGYVTKLLEYPQRMRCIVRPLAGMPTLLKPILWMMNKLGLVVPVVTSEEKKGRMSPVLHKIPNACAVLAYKSLCMLPRLNERRRTLTGFYLEYGRKRGWPIPAGAVTGLPLQKLPMFTAHASAIRAELKLKNMHLDDGWTNCVICPEGTDMDSSEYHWGSDPMAEAACKQVLCLPTHPTMTLIEAQRLARTLDPLLTTH